MNTVRNFFQKQNLLNQIGGTIPWVTFIFFCTTAILLIQNFDLIINQQPLPENKIGNNEVVNHIQNIQSVLKKMSLLPEQIGQKSSSVLINEYNQISDEFNELALSTLQIASLKKNIELKNKIIEANNKSFDLIENVKSQIRKSKKSTIQTVQNYLKNYQNIIRSVEKNNGSSVAKLNEPTQIFLINLICFSFLAITSVILNMFRYHRQKNILFQTESQLNTFQNVMNNMSEGVIVTNPQGFFTYYNQSALDIIGPHVKDIHYQSSLELMGFQNLKGEKIQKSDLLFQTALKKEITEDQEIYVQNEQHPEGLYISASSGFYVNQAGETAGSVVVMKNITHKKQLEELWIKQKEAAIEGSRKKSDFLASMSHEIRTPMNGIIGITTLLNETNLNPEQKDYVGTVQRSANSLLSLINDILDHSKIEAGKIDLISENFNLKTVIKDTLENFKYICSEKNIQLIGNYPGELPEYYIGDGNRIRQILMNLIGNAVKFTSIGQVELRLDFENNNEQTKIKFQINDTGAGMDPDEVDRLFQRFFQTKSGIKFGGTGLGLSISKQLVDLMGGTIGVSSKVNVGTTFWFELNLINGVAPSTTQNILTLTNLENAFEGSILVAEDNLVNQKVVSRYLNKLGFHVDIANNGAEAVQKFQTQNYDLIFMDCQMPLMTGYQATEQILKMQSGRSKCVPIVALTAEGTSGEKLKCFSSGMNDFLNKPLVFEQLAQLLKKYFKLKLSPLIPEDTVEKTVSSENSEIYKLGELKVGDQLLLHVLLDDYVSTTPDLIEKMVQSCNAKNAGEIHSAAHTLKSASAALSATTVSSLCAQIEANTAISDFRQIEVLLTQLQKEYIQSISEIQKIIFEIENSQKASA